MDSVRSGEASAKEALIRSATPNDLPVLSHVLARAFQHDPAHRWIFPAKPAWARNSHRRFEGPLKQTLRQGIVTTTEHLQGAALWISPQACQSLWERLLGTMRTVRLVGCRAPLVLQGLKAIEEAYPDTPHWALPLLGVDPGAQGKGIVGEIEYGLRILPAGKLRLQLKERLERFVSLAFGQRVLAYDDAAARTYSEVMGLGKEIGRPMSVLDGQIAAIARSNGLTVATRNTGNFEDCGVEFIAPFLSTKGS